MDEKTFRAAVDRGEFFEHEEYRGHLYGTPWSEIRRAIDEGQDLLLEPDVRGARSVKDRFGDAIAIFLFPPSDAELARRLRGRGTDSPEQIQERLAAARVELAAKDDFDHAVLNDDVARAVEEIEAILGLPNPEGAPS